MSEAYDPQTDYERTIYRVTFARCLTVHQPWAECLARGVKPVENRTWKTNYRGPVIIHSSQTFDCQAWQAAEALRAGGKGYVVSHGALLAVADLVDCVTEYDSDWFHGPYGFVLENVVRLPWTAQVLGRQSLWRLSQEDQDMLIQAIRRQAEGEKK